MPATCVHRAGKKGGMPELKPLRDSGLADCEGGQKSVWLTGATERVSRVLGACGYARYGFSRSYATRMDHRPSMGLRPA